jgi:hypothetical protein
MDVLVAIFEEDRLAAITACGHVMRDVRDDHSSPNSLIDSYVTSRPPSARVPTGLYARTLTDGSISAGLPIRAIRAPFGAA